MEGVAERHRLRVLELALDDGRPEPLPGKPLQDEQVVTFRVHLQEVHAVDVCVGQHIGKGCRIDDLLGDMAWVERGQATDTCALVGSIEDLSGADLVTDRTIVQGSEEHTSALQSLMRNLVCRLLLEKKKNYTTQLKTYDI